MAHKSLYFENTPARSAFRALAGDANFCLNTLLVGLETLKANTPIKPNDLVVAWKKPNTQAAWDGARLFALRGAMVAVIDGLDQYMRIISRIDGLIDPALDEYLNARKLAATGKKPSMAQRLQAIDKAYPKVMGAEHIAAAGLLATWRNRFVHGNSQAGLSMKDKKFLLRSAAYFRKNNGGVDIRAMVDRFENNEPPISADVGCMIACSHRIVTALDDHLLFHQTGRDYAIALVKFLFKQQDDPSLALEETFRWGFPRSLGRIYALLLDNGASDYAANAKANAPAIKITELRALFGTGRIKASALLGIPRPSAA